MPRGKKYTYVGKGRARRVRKSKTVRRKGYSNAKLTQIVRRLPAPEVKQARITYNNTDTLSIPDFNGVNWGLDAGVYTLNPTQNRINIAQGTGQGNRVGNRIKTKSSYVSGILFPPQQNSTYNPVPKPIDVLIFVYKQIGGGNTFSSAMSNFFQSGSSAISPTGGIGDLTYPVNTDQYRVLYRKHYKVGPAENTGSGSFIGLQYFANNDYKRNVRFRINLTKFMDKNMKFNDTSLNSNNDTLYLAIMPLMCDGAINTPGNALRPLSMIMTQVYNFTDV